MTKRFVIEDELHAEQIDEYSSIDDAWKELKRRAAIAWDQFPNRPPCGNVETCGRNYEILEYEVSDADWRVLRRIAALTMDASGLTWGAGAPDANAPAMP